MQIAKVVPKIRTRGEGIFDYSIPPEILPMIKIGLLVLVPFRGRNIEGIIVEIKRSSQILNLKPIVAVIDPVPVVYKTQTDLAKWMSDYYLSDFSKTLFNFVVPPAKRTIKKNLNYDIEIQSSPNINAKQYLIVADFASRLKFYLRAIKKTLAQKKQTIILVPDLSLIDYFTKYIKEDITIIHGNLTLTQRWLAWDKIRRGEAKIILGSTSAIFSPAPNLGLIIIDKEENETYKSDQSPRFSAIKVAQQLTKLTNVSLVLGSSAPSIETYFQAKTNKFLYKNKNEKVPDISIVNMTFEKQILSQPLKEKIELILENNQKAILVLNRRGQASRRTCDDCGWTYVCPQCQLPLNIIDDNFYCNNCEKQFSNIIKCPKCQSLNLKDIGLTTGKIVSIIKKQYPDAKIIRVEKDHEDDLNSDWNIAVVTSFALKKIFPVIEFVAIIDADQSLNFPGFRNFEKSFQNFYKFLSIAETGIIQTRLSESSFIGSLASLDYEKFYQTEIVNRQKFNFPPFVKLIKLAYRSYSEAECKLETQKVKTQIQKIVTQEKIELDILGPAPARNLQKRDYFYYQLILKLPKRNTTLDEFLKKLGKGWIIDVDPFDIV